MAARQPSTEQRKRCAKVWTLFPAQKLIKFADRSEAGWAVVDEYVDDELADDSEDEKRMERAERMAERKLAKRRKAATQETRGTKRRFQLQFGRQEEVPPPRASQPLPSPIVRAPFQPASGSGMPSFGGASGGCFLCRQFGHIKRDCPKKALGTSSQYPSHESYEESMGSKGVDCEGILSLDVDDVCSRCWEFQLDVHTSNGISSVKGSLGKCVDFWREELCASPWLIDTISKGYVLPIVAEPTPYCHGNQRSAIVEAEFVEIAIKELLEGGYVYRVAKQPHLCSPISVVSSGSGKKRLVVNLRHVNRFLLKQSCKYEDMRLAMLLFKPGEWMFSFDLKSGYHHIDIVPHHQKYLGFEWGGKYFVFTVLPFGLSTAPYVFTKLLRSLVGLWRGKGHKAILYLDDGICAVAGEREAGITSQWVKSTLSKAGFVVNEAKSTWVPTQKLQWLGFTIDLEHGQVFVPEKKLSYLRKLLEHACRQDYAGARQIASLIG